MILLINMLEFPLGVACGAILFWYVTPKVTCSRYFCFRDARRGNKFKHFHPKAMKIIKHDK